MATRIQCQCYQSRDDKTHRCQNGAKDGTPYCRVHRNCKIIFTPDQLVEPKPRQVEEVEEVEEVEPKPRQMGVVEPLPERDISHINMRMSLNKIKFDTIKSGLQKSIRRGLEDEAFAYAMEADLYSLAEQIGKAKGNRTNLMNRLRIILVEDLFDWRVILQVQPWFAMWEKERNLVSGRKYLLSIVRTMVKAKKIRLMSDLKVFLWREGYRRALGTTKYDDLFNGWNHGDSNSKPLDRFLSLLVNENPNCLYWYQDLYENGYDSSVWIALKDLVKNSTVINALHKIQLQLTKDHREKYLYTMCAIAMVLFSSQIDWQQDDHLPSLMTDQEADQLYQQHLNQWTPDNLPYGTAGWLPGDVVEDLHTQKGRSHGKNVIDFVESGSLVINEDKNFRFSRLREVYIAKKVADADPSKKPREIEPLDINVPTEPWEPASLGTHQVQEVAPQAKAPQARAPQAKAPQAKAPQAKAPQAKADDEVEITMADLNADQIGPIYGQKVTAEWKPLTYITKDWVYKGPYTGKRSTVPQVVMDRYQKFMKYKDLSAMPQQIARMSDGKIYLRSPNVGRYWPPKTSGMDEMVHGWSQLKGRIVIRDSMGIYQGNDLIERKELDWERALYHFIIRYIMNVGDSGSWNLINNYGVDYEEDRTPDKEEPSNVIQIMFKKPLAKKFVTVYERAIQQNAKVLIFRLENDVLPKVSGEELKRTLKVLALLHEYQ